MNTKVCPKTRKLYLKLHLTTNLVPFRLPNISADSNDTKKSPNKLENIKVGEKSTTSILSDAFFKDTLKVLETARVQLIGVTLECRAHYKSFHLSALPFIVTRKRY